MAEILLPNFQQRQLWKGLKELYDGELNYDDLNYAAIVDEPSRFSLKKHFFEPNGIQVKIISFRRTGKTVGLFNLYISHSVCFLLSLLEGHLQIYSRSAICYYLQMVDFLIGVLADIHCRTLGF